MASTIDISVDERQLAEIRELLAGVPSGVPRVLTRAINKVGVAARTQVVRRVCQEVNLKVSEVRDRNVTLRKANYTTLMAVLRFSGRRVPLKKWGARQTKRGISYAIRKGQRKVLEHAFLAAMDSGHVGVFLRTGQPRISRRTAERTNRRTGRQRGMAFMTRPRLPIDERFGPSVPEIIEDIQELSRAILDERIATDLHGEVYTQVGLVLQRHGGAANG